MKPFRLGLIISTTRTGRFADKPTQWLLHRLADRREFAAETIDLRDYPMPLFDEAAAPAHSPPQCVHARRWADRVGEMDAFIFLTAEYNHSIPAALKNTLDHAYVQFNRKPAAFVGYGGVGAARAIEHLRLICIELQLAPLRSAVHVGMEAYLDIAAGRRGFEDFDHLNTSATALFDELAWWTAALGVARAELQDQPGPFRPAPPDRLSDDQSKTGRVRRIR